MKGTILSVFILAGLTLVFSQYAAANIEAKGEHIQVMRQAATELQTSNPDLAKKLNEFADKKEKYGEKSAEMMAQKQQDIQKIRQAAGELEDDDNVLADDLNNLANRWEEKMKEKEAKY
jgi:cytochrome c556